MERKCVICDKDNINIYKCKKCTMLMCSSCFYNMDHYNCPQCRSLEGFIDPDLAMIDLDCFKSLVLHEIQLPNVLKFASKLFKIGYNTMTDQFDCFYKDEFTDRTIGEIFDNLELDKKVIKSEYLPKCLDVLVHLSTREVSTKGVKTPILENMKFVWYSDAITTNHRVTVDGFTYLRLHQGVYELSIEYDCENIILYGNHIGLSYELKYNDNIRFTCDICKRMTYLRLENLKIHMKRNHNNYHNNVALAPLNEEIITN